MDMSVFADFITSLLCPECSECSLYIEEDFVKKKGLASLINVKCYDCDFCITNYTSKTVTTDKVKGMRPFEINYRAVYALRSVGVGFNGLEKVCGILNLPKPMTRNNYDNISNVLKDSAKCVAEKSMQNAVNELTTFQRISYTTADGPVIDIGVSVDGSWQRRGYSSLNGVITAISIDSGKIVDVESMSRYCRLCQINKESLTIEDFEVWHKEHKKADCKLNYSGSAPSMETEGAKRIFQRSVDNRKARYMSYFGDGDSKAFKEVEDIYSPEKIVKYECIGHYQKRVGCNDLGTCTKNKVLWY